MIYVLGVLVLLAVIALLPSRRPRSRRWGRSADEIRAEMKRRGQEDKKVRGL